LELTWPDARVDVVPYRRLREECPCAVCVDEITGERVLDVTTIAADIRPAAIAFVGNYALRIDWSDGHNTGLYAWDKLRRIADS
jgi:DUF971 family protein